ncbi:MAG TPA: Holliday junction branch migration protein RuvA [Firmicutes bacterium]|nr:Holliday junction branch migration protein RuvA [Bacillota bacterium]
MIDYLSGRLVESSPGAVVLNVGGIGIQVTVPPSAEPAEVRIGEQVTYYTRLMFREDELLLYGFEKPVERDFFNLVISVSGFGPKLALSMLGMLSVSQIYQAILKEDTSLLCQVPGIGRKNSQRLILELKDRLPKLIPAGMIGQPVISGDQPDEDLTEALLSLGYSRTEAAAAINRVHRESTGQISNEELLRLVLQSLAGR